MGLIGVGSWSVINKKMSSKADVGSKIANTATSTYKDGLNNSYSATSNTIFTDIIANYPTWSKTFTHYPQSWALASFPHTVDKDIDEIQNYPQIDPACKFNIIGAGYDCNTISTPRVYEKVSWSEGLWIYTEFVNSVSYQAPPLIGNQYVDLKDSNNGWYLIGYPFDKPMLLESIKLKKLNGDVPEEPEKTFNEVKNLWIQEPVIGYNPAPDVHGYFNIRTVPTGADEGKQLEPWNGYWVYIFNQNAPDGVRLIFPESAQILSGGTSAPQIQTTNPDSTKKKKKK